MRNITPIFISLALVAICCSAFSATVFSGETKKQGKKPVEYTFNADEAKFLVQLAEKSKDFKQMVVLLGLAQSANIPKTPALLLASLVQEKATAKLPDVGDTVKNLKFICDVKTRDEVILFRMGKHPDFYGKKPAKANYRYFKDLEDNLSTLINKARPSTQKK